MDTESYSLDDLAGLTGIEPRTIRSYIAAGLLRGPVSRGPKARYTDYHLKRLETIKLLRERDGLRLDEIRRHLLTSGDEGEPELFSALQMSADDLEASDCCEEPRSMASYSRRARWARRESALMREMPPPSGADPQTREAPSDSCAAPRPSPAEELLHSLARAMEGRKVPRAARGEAWTHIEITPDIHLSLRGEYDPDRRMVFERIADHLRQILLGGGEGPPSSTR